jgi:hypothetical protein
MDQALIDHTIEQLRGRATSDMVAFNALAIIEAYGRGEDPLAAAPKRDAEGEMAAKKHAVFSREEAHEDHPKKRGRK